MVHMICYTVYAGIVIKNIISSLILLSPVMRKGVIQVQDYIFRIVYELMKKYKTSDPFALIDLMGIHLYKKNDLGRLKGFYHMVNRERYVVINSGLNERDQLLVAAHELAHDRLHQRLAKVSPLKDFQLCDMTSRTEHQANVFASELLITDEDILDCVTEGMDYFFMCRTLGFNPHLVTFKLYGMIQRGYRLDLPNNINSKFLAQKEGQYGL